MADLLPSFSLTGAAGLTTANVEDVFNAESHAWLLGLAGGWPLLDRGAQQAEIDIARSRYGAAGADPAEGADGT